MRRGHKHLSISSLALLLEVKGLRTENKEGRVGVGCGGRGGGNEGMGIRAQAHLAVRSALISRGTEPPDR